MEDNTQRVWVCDLEGNGLKYEITKVWCVVAWDQLAQVYHISVPEVKLNQLLTCLRSMSYMKTMKSYLV